VASNNNDSASVPSFAVNSPRFSINFREVEDSTRPFNGDDTLAVEAWISDFEDMGIFAKRSLKGLAKVFIMSERGIKNWQMLKNALIKEFNYISCYPKGKSKTMKLFKNISSK